MADRRNRRIRAVFLDARFARRARALALGAHARFYPTRLFGRRHGVVRRDRGRTVRHGETIGGSTTIKCRRAQPRKQVRLEAENFRTLNGFAVEYLNEKKASQTLQAALKNGARGRIATTFQERFVQRAAARWMCVIRMKRAGTAGSCSS